MTSIYVKVAIIITALVIVNLSVPVYKIIALHIEKKKTEKLLADIAKIMIRNAIQRDEADENENNL